jgi:ABC-type transport system substrate-binding protein
MSPSIGLRGLLAFVASAVVAFSSLSAHAERSRALHSAEARRAHADVVLGLEHDVTGFNTNLTCCRRPSVSEFPENAVVRGAFTQNARGAWVKDLVSAAAATPRTLSYTIRKGASWYWGGRRLPITYRDFVYSLQQLDNPANAVASRSGYNQIDPTRFRHHGARRITFFWRTQGCTPDAPCGPYGDWQSLFAFGSLYPAQALAGEDFNVAWARCICGSDGKPVSDGPFYLSSYATGEGMTLKRNPYWSGRRAGLAQVDFKIVGDAVSAVQQVQRGELDGIAPSFGPYLLPLRNRAGLTFRSAPGYSMEQLAFNLGESSSNPLLRAPWMRRAISLAIDRQAIIQTLYGQVAGNLRPLNSLLFFEREAPYRPDFAALSYSPRKSLEILARHCSEGPSSPGGIWVCSGFPAQFGYSWPAGDAMRSVQEAMIEAQLKTIGIALNRRPVSAPSFFGPSGIQGGAFDVANFALNTTGDPNDLSGVWGCGGAVNVTKYCNLRVTQLLNAADVEPDPAKRTRDYEAADRLLAADVPGLPLYQRPLVLVASSRLEGPDADSGPIGPYGNIEAWRWKP